MAMRNTSSKIIPNALPYAPTVVFILEVVNNLMFSFADTESRKDLIQINRADTLA